MSEIKIKEDMSANMSLLKEKYKKMLGSKEPVVVLRNCLLPKTLPKLDSLRNDFPTIHRVVNANLKNNNNKKNDKNSKVCKRQKPKYRKKTLNHELQPSKCTNNSKKRKTNTKVSIVDTKKFNSDSWKIKHDAVLKSKALENIEKLKVCLGKIAFHDSNSNVVRPSDELKILQKNYTRKKAQHTVVEKKRKKTINNSVKIKHKQNTYENVDINKNKKSYSSCVDFDNISHSAVDLSSIFFSKNYILNKYMTSTQAHSSVDNQVLKEPNEHGIKEENLSLGKAKDNTTAVRSFPTIISEDTLHKNSIKLKIKGTEISENCNKGATNYNNGIINKEINFQVSGFSSAVSKNIVYNNECYEINGKQNSSIKSNYVIPQLQRKITDCDKDANYEKAINAINNENYGSLENNATEYLFNTQNKSWTEEYNGELDKENNKTTLFRSQFLLPENYTSHTVVTAINNLDKRYRNTERSTDALNANNSLKHVQEKIKEDTVNNVIRYSLDNTNVRKRKCVNSNKDINSPPVKRIKLDRNHSTKSVNNVCETSKNVSATDTTSSINVELDTKEILPQLTISSVTRLNNVLSTEDVITETGEIKSKTDKGISGFIKQNRIKSVADVGVQDCDLLQNTRKSKEVASNVCESSVENQCLISAKKSPNSEDPMENTDDENDCISLFADSTLMNEYDSFESGSCDRSYYMTDNLFDNYYKNNQSEFNEMYENNNVADTSKEMKCILTTVPTKPRTGITVHQIPLLLNAFQGYCYKMIQTGRCCKRNCCFKHNFQTMMQLLYHRDEQNFFKVLEELATHNFILFIEKIFRQIIYGTGNIFCILKILKKLFDLNALTNEMATYVFRWLQMGKNPMKVISNQLATIVNDYDSKFINWILSALQRCTECGEYWDTFRSLLLRTKHLEPQIIQIILQDCIITKKHLHDINTNIISKLNTESYSQINKKLLATFNNLIEPKESNVEVKQSVSSQPIGSINPPVDKNLETHDQTDISCKTSKEDSDDSNKKAQSENSSFILHPIDNLPNPYSVHGRNKFWKFYVDVYSLQKGLENNDYGHVIEVLNSAKKNQQSPFTTACYQILCNEIMCSQHHLSKLISHAVRLGTTRISYQILLDVAIHILVHLAEKNFWVLAYTLLKDVYIMLKSQINLYQFDATTIMLFAEVYLANHQPVKALTLLKQSNIIFTNRTKWKVRSTMKDDYIRVQIMTFLLESLCPMHPEYAFFLFRLLITDQSTNFYPIDLARFANKMVSVLLLGQYNDLIVDVGILIDDYYVLLDTITYRALIATLVHVDMSLAKQLYQNAIALGIYSKPQFHPVTYLIINSDWTTEEMFLAIFNLMKQLSSNIGHAIDHISSRQLTVYLIFENIPIEEQLNYDTGTNECCAKKIKESETQMRNLMKEKFDPPILVIKQTRGKVLKLNSKSVLTYLRSEHYE